MTPNNLIVITELMLLAVAVAIAVKYIRLPYTVALVVVGLGVGIFDLLPNIELSKEIILFIFLPPLLFEGTINMDLKLLKDNGLLVGLLAIFGTLICTVMMGGILQWLLHLPLPVALLLGAMITPTDPVSVLATFKEYGVAKGLSTIVEGESVFNDGIGVVIYLLLLSYIGGNAPDAVAAWALKMFAWEVLIGAGIGLVLGYITHLVLGQIDDNLIEVLLSLILAYGSYLVAERFHCSGVVAVVCAGLIMGNYGRILSMSPKTRITLSHFWEVIAFAANSLLFLLIGTNLDSAALLSKVVPIGLVFLFLIAARAITVYGISFIANYFKKRHPLPLSWIHIANWAGLRGSIPIALALGVSTEVVSQREELLTIVFGVVFLSLVVQGLTIKPLLKLLGLIGDEDTQIEFEKALGRRIATKAAIRELRLMQSTGEISDQIFDELIGRFEAKDQEQSYSLALLKQENPELADSMRQRIARRLGYAEHTALQQAFIQGVIGDHTLEQMVEQIDADIEIGKLAIIDENGEDEDQEDD